MKLKMLSGLPASGKSTEARRLVDTGNSGRINRDDLRAMVFNGVWTGKREGVIVDIEKAIAEVLIKHKLTPVIDDTNLTEKHKNMWSGFAKAHGVAFESYDLSKYSTLLSCIMRDRKRDNPVGEAVIYRMALGAGMLSFGDKAIVLCDIDGTLADGTHREKHIEGSRKDWKTYFSLLSEDAPIDIVTSWVTELFGSDHIICLVSGRPDTYQHETIRWLKKHEIPYDYLFMRRGNDKRPDTEVKKEILDLLPKDQIKFVIDDRPSVVRMWKEQGLTVYPVKGQCEEF
jgi:predicted kinase